MRKPHKHAELIKAWADGAEIQLKMDAVHWGDCVDPYWNPDLEYRIKPEPKPDVVRWCWATDKMGESKDHFGKNGSANLKLVFDGETGKLKSAELL